MSFAQLTNKIVELIGKVLVDSDYTIPEYQKTQEDNIIDFSINKIKELKQRWQSSIEAKILNKHQSSLKGFNLPIYEIQVNGDSYKVNYTLLGKSIFLMYGVNPQELQFSLEPDTEPQQDHKTIDNAIASYDQAGLIKHEPEYCSAPGGAPVREEFKESKSKKEICYRLLYPYQQIGEQNHRTYYKILQKIFDPWNNVSLFKALVIVDEISDFLKKDNKNLLPGQSYSLDQNSSPQNSRLEFELNKIFEKHLPIDNNSYTK